MTSLRSIAAPVPGQVALYRFFDAEEILLYVGISSNPRRRWKEHAIGQPWYPQVRHQSLTWYGSEAEARRAEVRAIRGERPRFNVAGALRPVPGRIIFRPYRWVSAWFYLALVMTACGAIGSFLPAWRSVVVPCLAITTVGAAVLGAATAVVVYAPQILRFISWVERNSAAERMAS